LRQLDSGTERTQKTNKAELVEEVSGKAGITKKDAGNTVKAVTRTITNTLKKGEKFIFSRLRYV